MGDFRLQWDARRGSMDLCIVDDDLASDEGLATAALLSAMTDRRAEDGEPVPGDPADRRGWWADEFLEPAGDRMGSRLWLLSRGKAINDAVESADAYLREAFAWAIDDGAARSVEAASEIEGTQIRPRVTIRRPADDDVEFRFDHAWDAEVG